MNTDGKELLFLSVFIRVIRGSLSSFPGAAEGLRTNSVLWSASRRARGEQSREQTPVATRDGPQQRMVLRRLVKGTKTDGNLRLATGNPRFRQTKSRILAAQIPAQTCPGGLLRETH